MPTPAQIEKYLKIAKDKNLNLSKDDILFLWGFMSSVIESELSSYEK
jgi:hypothetical protein